LDASPALPARCFVPILNVAKRATLRIRFTLTKVGLPAAAACFFYR